MNEGFQLNPTEIADRIGRYITQPGAHLHIDLDSYARPDFNTGMSIVHDPVDRAVFVFVGSREQAATIYQAAKELLTA